MLSATSLPWRIVGVAGASLLAVGAFAGVTAAATPSSGSVSPTNPNATYTAGPFTTPNVTGNAGDPMCGTAATPCDDYKLNVSTPAGYGDSHSLRVTVQWANSAADFDLYVLDSSGSIVGSSASSSDPEMVTLPPNGGSYTVRVVPYNPLGQSITGTVALAANPVQPPPSNAPASGFKNFPAPASLPNAHNAGEPSIGYDYATNKAMYQAYTSTYRVGFSKTSPTTATYVDRDAKAAKGCPQGSTTSLDPILFTDHRTNRTFESQLSGTTSLACYTDDDGDSWTPTEGGPLTSGVDHQTYGGGPFSKNGLLGPTTSYPDAVYYCSQNVAYATCALSRNGGLTFGASVPIYNLTQCGGLHGHVKVSPDGTVYVPNKDCNGKAAVVVSTDNGLHWVVRPIPTSSAGAGDPSVGIGSNGTVYVGYQGSDNQAHIAVSHDRGETWSHDQNVGAQLGLKNIDFPAVVAGDDNRAAFAFLGTTTGGNSNDPKFAGVWHLNVATTYDGGVSYKTSDATPNNPVQRGEICTNGTTCGNSRNLLDFIDVTADPQGRVLAGYADGCTAQCVSNTGDKTATYYNDALATIARQSTGFRLLAKYDPLPDLVVSGLQEYRSNGTVHISGVAHNGGTAPASNVSVRFYTGGSSCSDTIGNSAPTSLAPGVSRRVSVVWTTAKVGKTYPVCALVDPANKVRESNEGNNRTSRSIAVK